MSITATVEKDTTKLPKNEDEQIARVLQRQVQPGFTLARRVDGKTLRLQSGGHEPGNLLSVFDQKDAHREAVLLHDDAKPMRPTLKFPQNGAAERGRPWRRQVRNDTYFLAVRAHEASRLSCPRGG